MNIEYFVAFCSRDEKACVASSGGVSQCMPSYTLYVFMLCVEL